MGHKKRQRPKDDPQAKSHDADEASALFYASLDALENDPAWRQKFERDNQPLTPKPGKSPRPPATLSIDLHGLSLTEAQAAVDQYLQRLLREYTQPFKVRIITGKGRHSSGTSVLARDIHTYVTQQYRASILKIDESPDAIRLHGLPLRGHFDVTLQKR